jgi:hypothetical protein
MINQRQAAVYPTGKPLPTYPGETRYNMESVKTEKTYF